MPAHPTLALIATGGTIAGAAARAADTRDYTAGVLPARALLDAVPHIEDIAAIRVETPFAIDSKDMRPAHWIALARCVQRLLDTPDIDGIVITHGTDTMEETAHVLTLALSSDKPVVLTGAMRPATALSADGPMNLHDAVCVAAHPDSARRGVMLSFAREILPAWGLRKRDCDQLAAFTSFGGPIGRTAPVVRYFHPPAPRRWALGIPDEGEPMPRVDILQVGAGCAFDLAHAAAAAGARGIVLALPGNGSLPDTWHTTVGALVQGGVTVVRATRCGEGEVHDRDTDGQLGTWPAGLLSPAAARVVLMLGLAARRRSPDFDLAAFFQAASRALPAHSW